MQMLGDDNNNRKMLEYTSTSNTRETLGDIVQKCFLCQFCNVTKMAWWFTRRFSRIGLHVKDECKTFKTFFYIFCYILEPCIKIWWFLLTFGWILIIKNLKKHLILVFSHFYITFWLYITSTKNISSNIRKTLGGHGATLKKLHETLELSNNFKENFERHKATCKKTFGGCWKNI